ncbi:hypothetical protein JAAARDRAFT_211195 [Jaapia argillacea MUCL 33604]|uniref:Uncharacterized protein n=1 Tax=Jaapia argillacea MUCL 33604 TaxID=933084 RepID=A0A067P8I9_9AGAM|nr:hypothetical protein JAAARDRAFT_211195 [Jaapia argillacea MUCL 33604]
MNSPYTHTRSPRIALDRCPPEICGQIFTLACNDEGSTARALSLVSRYIHDVSDPVRYQSIAAAGLEQMLAFITRLEARAPEKRFVRNLYLCSFPSPKRPSVYTRDGEESDGTQRFRGVMKRKVPSVAKIQESRKQHLARLFPSGEIFQATLNAIIRILSLSSNTLETLALIMPQSTHFLLPPSISLPSLIELSIYSMCSGHTSWNPSTPNPLPSLRRLHLAGRYFSESQIISLAHNAPALIHLRLSGMEDNIFLRFALNHLLGSKESDWDTDSDSEWGPSSSPSCRHMYHRSLKNVLVQTRPPTMFGCSHAARTYHAALTSLQSLQVETSSSSPGETSSESKAGPDIQEEVERVTFLKPGKRDKPDAYALEAKTFWLARLAGGMGCWDMSRRINVEELVTSAAKITVF